MENRAEAIANAKTFLRENGKLLVYVVEERVGQLMTSEKLATIDGRPNPHFVISWDVSAELQRFGIAHKLIHFPRILTICDEDMMSFELYTDYAKLDDDMKLEICETIEKNKIEVDMAKPGFYERENYQKIAELSFKLAKIEAAINEAEQDWLVAEEALDTKQQALLQ